MSKKAPSHTFQTPHIDLLFQQASQKVASSTTTTKITTASNLTKSKNENENEVIEEKEEEEEEREEEEEEDCCDGGDDARSISFMPHSNTFKIVQNACDKLLRKIVKSVILKKMNDTHTKPTCLSSIHSRDIVEVVCSSRQLSDVAKRLANAAPEEQINHQLSPSPSLLSPIDEKDKVEEYQETREKKKGKKRKNEASLSSSSLSTTSSTFQNLRKIQKCVDDGDENVFREFKALIGSVYQTDLIPVDVEESVNEVFLFELNECNDNDVGGNESDEKNDNLFDSGQDSAVNKFFLVGGGDDDEEDADDDGGDAD